MYVAVKGGEAAIANAHRLLDDRRRGDRSVPALTLEQIVQQLALAVDRAMAEGSLYDPDLAAMAVRQARGDLIEAIFLLRAYRTTLPRFANSIPIDTGEMSIERRISATYKDLPGGQLLGPTFDYTHRLIEPDMAVDRDVNRPERRSVMPGEKAPRVTDILGADAMIEPDGDPEPGKDPAVHRGHFQPIVMPGCRRWRAATRASCWRSAIRRSVATAEPIPLSARSGSARSMWRSTSPSLALPS